MLSWWPDCASFLSYGQLNFIVAEASAIIDYVNESKH